MTTTSTKRFWLVAVLTGLLAISLVSCTTPALAGGGPQSTSASLSTEPMPRTITVSGLGIASAIPDVAFIQLGAETVATDAAEAVSENSQRMTAVMDVLAEMGVADEDIQTVNFNVWIEQVTDKDGRPTGEIRYHVTNYVSIQLQDIAQAGELLQKSLAAGANTVGGISFGVTDPTALQREARDVAIADAKARAEQLATGLGAELGGVRQVTEYSSGVSPVMRGDSGGGYGGGAPISGGQYSASVEIQVVFDIVE